MNKKSYYIQVKFDEWTSSVYRHDNLEDAIKEKMEYQRKNPNDLGVRIIEETISQTVITN